MDLFFCQVFWLRGHRCHGFHTRELVPASLLLRMAFLGLWEVETVLQDPLLIPLMELFSKEKIMLHIIRTSHPREPYSEAVCSLLEKLIAFSQLMAPAHEALGAPCLQASVIGEYPWPEGISLIMIFILFFIELMATRLLMKASRERTNLDIHKEDKSLALLAAKPVSDGSSSRRASYVPGVDHLGHADQHVDIEGPFAGYDTTLDNYAAQMTAIFILEFGVIFHSIFIGLTLAVAGEEFKTLYVVLVFHQTFEGLGLGARLAVTPWPKNKRWTPYVLALAYGLSTPISIAVGLGVRETYAGGARTTLIINGVFDSISAGILIYTGLVELIAHEFIFSRAMMTAPLKVTLYAFGFMTLGAGE
jgi:solute carrier family 39 (zinc transporter), member 1/2/3